jgi:DNA recombination protein RmuC
MNFRSLALAKRSTEVWKVLTAVRSEFGRYNDVVSKLGNQLRTAAGSVERLSVRTRAMDRKLRTVEMLPDDGSAQRLLGLDNDAAINQDDEEAMMADLASEITAPPVSAEEPA